jgi:hypothetical protein
MFTGISRDKNNGRHDPHNFRPLCDNAAMSEPPNLNRNRNLLQEGEACPNRARHFKSDPNPNLCQQQEPTRNLSQSVFIRGLNSCRQGHSLHCQPNRRNNLKMPKMPKSVQSSPEPGAHSPDEPPVIHKRLDCE